MNQENYYQILNIPSSADEATIKTAYRHLAKKFHPDLNHQEGSEELFKVIQEAYAVLSNPEKRKLYDQSLNQNYQQNSYTSSNQNNKNTASSSSQANSTSQPKYTYTKNPSFNWIGLIRTLVGFFFLAFIPILSFLGNGNLNSILLYYGWLLVLYLFTQLIYGLTTLTLGLWFIMNLFEGHGANLIWAILIWIVVTGVVWIIKPSTFES